MATPPWVILGRSICAEYDDAAPAAPAPDFTLPVASPPLVSILAAGRSVHPDPNRPDEHPYIIAAAPHCLLAHFAVAPSIGMCYDDNPHDTHLILVRHLNTADGRTTATAVRVPDRVDPIALLNIGSVGLISNDQGACRIFELQIDITDIDPSKLVWFDSGSGQGWSWEYVAMPFPPEEDLQVRKWLPHGAVSIGSTLWWFDLRWGILSCDLSGHPEHERDPDFLFHCIPEGRALDEATPLMFAWRCITVSQNQLRYVEIIPVGGDDDSDDDASQAATVSLWTLINGHWNRKYEVSFEEIWNDNSYRATELPRCVPSLAVVCPSNLDLVYFNLKKHLLGVNVPDHRVVHHDAYYGLVNNSWMEPASRNILPWTLPPGVAAALSLGG